MVGWICSQERRKDKGLATPGASRGGILFTEETEVDTDV
jgi:hypothetical protein